MLAPEEPVLITPKLLWKGRSLIYGVQNLIALSDERAGAPKSVAQIAVAHFSILQSPHPAGCGTATSATARGGTRGEETLRVSRVHRAFFIRQWR
jgi:hypothetical protein